MQRTLPGQAAGLAVAVSLLMMATAVDAENRESLRSDVAASLTELEPKLIEIRRDLHRHPEVSGEEKRTARVIAEHLRVAGLDVRTLVGGHGVVALLQGTRPGPVVAYRADIDAVYSQAEDPVEFRSVNEGVRHICGHDVHTAIGLGLAQALALHRERLAGKVLFVFQPAEENATGARAMLADGVFDEHRPRAIYALHTAPLEVGQLATREGVMMAGRDRIEVRLEPGKDQEVDAQRARELVKSLSEQGTLSAALQLAQQTDPFSVVQFGPVAREGNAVVLRGMATTSDIASSREVERRLRQEITATPDDEMTITLEYELRSLAGVVNDPELTRRASAVIGSVVDPQNVLQLTALVPAFSEDFGSFQDQVPGVMFFLGVSNSEKGIVGMPHSPSYVADEAAILIGAQAMAAVLIEHLDD